MDNTVLIIGGVVAGVAALSLALAARDRVPWRLAWRNVRRGRWRTVLLILGLLVGTTIVSSSLVIGDTVNALSVHYTYLAYGFTDEGVYETSPSGAYALFNASVAVTLQQRTTTLPEIAGITPEIVTTAQLLDRHTGVPQTNLNLIGVDPSASQALGAFTATNGSVVSGAFPGGVLLDVQAAQDVNASVGDSVVIYGANRVVATVSAIVEDDSRGGFLFGGNLFVPVSTAQQLENASGLVNFIAVTNSGSLHDGVALSDSVSADLNRSLRAMGAPAGLTVHELLKDNLAQAEQAGNQLTTLFLVLGLFSIVAGGMLIVGLFVMLAEERKGEMGMLRAIGLKRGQLVMTYYLEGLLYSAGSALLGTGIGVGVGFGIVYAFAKVFASSSVTGAAILQSFSVATDSLFIAYGVGFLLTLGTVTVASWRASRINIVRAIRSIPEPAPSLRAYTRLAYLGLAFVGIGLWLFLPNAQGSGDASPPVVGLGVAILGVALLASRWVRNRYAFTAAGGALLAWGGSPDLHRWLLGSEHSGTIALFFVEGIFLVLGAVLVYVFNSDLVVAAATRLGVRRPSSVAVVRIGLSYPSRRAFRTAITLSIFSLVLFTVVAVAAFGTSINAGLNRQIEAQSGGYTFFGLSAAAIPDLPGAIANNSTLAPEFSTVVPLETGPAVLTLPASDGGGEYPYPVFFAPAGQPASEDFYTTNAYNFSELASGYTPASVWAALQQDPGVAVVDHQFAPQGVVGSFGGPHPRVAPGDRIPVMNPVTNRTLNVTVIGVLGEDLISGVWMSPLAAGMMGYAGYTAFFLSVAAGASPLYAAQQAKAAFLPFGLVLFDFVQILQSSIQSTEAIVNLLEVFVALGLAVGIAAIGIVALRAVVERRGEIGMLRALGMTRGAVLRVFLLEYSYVSLIGIGIGAVLGVVLDYSAAQASAGFLYFALPLVNILIVIGSAYLLTLLAVVGPSVKASRTPPAEALRYSE
ncbi:MAG TPA: FtsX-like permease family protein [Thermoplasmata archaeon]|nr:FtsX-like permease family protein [Thermoplasmata archaeon]